LPWNFVARGRHPRKPGVVDNDAVPTEFAILYSADVQPDTVVVAETNFVMSDTRRAVVSTAPKR
jgi:hypothetical protein